MLICLFTTIAIGGSYSSSYSSSSSGSKSSSSSSSSYSKPSSYSSSSKPSSYSSSSYNKPSSYSSSSSYKTSSSYSTPKTSSYSSSYNKPTSYQSSYSSPKPTSYSSSNVKTTSYTSSSYNKPVNSYKTSTSSNSVSSNTYNHRTYSSYSRPITRTPKWYHDGYDYRFSNSRYNSGYRYYPVYCDPFIGNLSSFVAGAIITQMILDDGRRNQVYSDGMGGAYTVINGQNILLARDENGNWVQLDPIAQPIINDNPVIGHPVVPVNNYHNESKGLGVGGWIIVILLVAILGVGLIFLVR